MKKLLIVILITVFGCSDLYVIPEDHYIIEAGEHESKLANGVIIDKLRTLKSDQLRFTARFDESARYNLNNNDQFDINKLFGFADANSLHHDNSARFGWRYNVDKRMVEILTYVYQAGVVSYELITDVAINANHQYQITIHDNSYEFFVNNVSRTSPRSIQNNKGVYYMLFPYFGGNQVAPHDVHIFIKEEF